MPQTETAKAAADRVRAETWGDVIPVDPAQIATFLGLQVVEAKFNEDVAGALVKRTGEDPKIYLNWTDSSNRKRFTCAHEIGHYVLRSEASDEYEYFDFRDSFSSTGTDPDERYANAFAASLLMPEEHVKRQKAEGLSDVEMAVRFGVSREAMQYRLRNLKIGIDG